MSSPSVSFGINTTNFDYFFLLISAAQGMRYAFAIARDLGKIFGRQAILLAVVLADAAYLQRSESVRGFAELCSQRIGSALTNFFK